MQRAVQDGRSRALAVGGLPRPGGHAAAGRERKRKRIVLKVLTVLEVLKVLVLRVLEVLAVPALSVC